MNRYGSAIRTYFAPNVYEGTIAPPTATIIPSGDFSQIVQTYSTINEQSNFIVKRVGLFSNIADGLILASAACRPRITIECFQYTLVPMVGTVTFVAGKAVTGIGTLFTSLSSGDVIQIQSGLYTVDTVADDLNMTVTQYRSIVTPAFIINASYSALNVSIIPANITVQLLATPVLNCFHETEKFVPIALYGDDTFIKATLTCPDGLDLLTNTIDPSITGPVLFDIGLELEITPNT